MAKTRKYWSRFEKLIRDIFSELGEFECTRDNGADKARSDLILTPRSGGRKYRIEARFRERITPQIADDLFTRLQEEPRPKKVVRIVYSPVISPRVAEIAREHDMSFMDSAGNCRIVNSSAGLLILRSGIENKASIQKPKYADPFSQKSSRIVRVMLHEPARGWHVRELAEHPDVDVSPALASKVKQSLVHQSYAVTRGRLLYLKRPLDLLGAWTREYPGPSSERQFYMRGDTQEVESTIADWCEQSQIEYALARFSAAWRHAPEVRYSVASVYVTSRALRTESLEALRAECGAKQVDSGANLVLLLPFDKSVFVRRVGSPQKSTSPLQTYLDLQSMAGRGEEAAEAIFEKHLREALTIRDEGAGGS